jgi:hypothetical protein
MYRIQYTEIDFSSLAFFTHGLLLFLPPLIAEIVSDRKGHDKLE